MISANEPQVSSEINGPALSQVPTTDSNFDEFDMFANFTKDTQDGSGSYFDW